MEQIKLHQFREKLQLLGYAKRSCIEYTDEVERFLRHLEEKESVGSVLDIKPEHIQAWHAHMTFEASAVYKRRLASGTVWHRLQVIRMFFKIMYQENLLPFDYTAAVILPKYQRSLPKQVPDVNAIRRLLQAAVPDGPLGKRDRFMLELLYATGIRNQEICELTLQRLNIQDRTVHVTGKGSKDRVVPLGEWVIPYALEYLHTGRPYLVRLVDTDLLFPSRNGWPLPRQNLNWILRKYANIAGLPNKITPHILRHACATHMLQAGADIRYVQELLGHEDLNSTQIYTRVTIGDLKKAHLKYHPANRDEFRDEPAA